MEILTSRGETCGCMNVPNGNTSVGRDGSLIILKSERPPAASCPIELYPQLFR